MSSNEKARTGGRRWAANFFLVRNHRQKISDGRDDDVYQLYAGWRQSQNWGMVAGRSDHGDIGRYCVADRPLMGNTREQENRTIQDNELRVEKDGEQGQGLSDTLLLRRDDRRMSELFCTIPSCQHPDVCRGNHH